MLAPDDSVLPLNSEERARLGQLEDLIETTLQKFLICGRALSEIHHRKLYREEFPSFETYCAARWGISAHRACALVRSVTVAETLLAGHGRAQWRCAATRGFGGECPAAAIETSSGTAKRMLAPSVQGHRKANSFRCFENRSSHYVRDCRWIRQR